MLRNINYHSASLASWPNSRIIHYKIKVRSRQGPNKFLEQMLLAHGRHLPLDTSFYWKLFVFFSGYGYSFPLKKKSEAWHHFRDLIMRLENTDEVPERTETYVSDHGGETIMSLEFQRFLSDKGIFWQTAPRHTPNFNGLVERNIQTKQAIQRALHI